ncbi:MAG: hypothetical protein JXR62_01175, partial [Bacilli bacterium]|nr:hypothetical protein [Bacilli bacterium]
QGNVQTATTTNIIDEINAFNLDSEDYISLAQNDFKTYMQTLTIEQFTNLGLGGDLAKREELEATYNVVITLVEIYSENYARLYDFSYTDETRTNSRDFFVYVNPDPEGTGNLEDLFDDQFDDFFNNSEEMVVFSCSDSPETCQDEFADIINLDGNHKDVALDSDILFTGDPLIDYNSVNGVLSLNGNALLVDGNLTFDNISLIEGSPYYQDFGVIYISGNLYIDQWFGFEINNTLIVVKGEVFINFDAPAKNNRILEGSNFTILSLTAIDNVSSSVRIENNTFYTYMEEDAFFYIGDYNFSTTYDNISDLFNEYGMTIQTDAFNFYNN